MKSDTLHASGKKETTPLELGYRMPAEWERHEATWLAWPHNKETWPGKLRAVDEIYLQMIEALTGHEKVCLLVNDERTREKVARELAPRRINPKNLTYHLIPTVDTWIRDYGPNFILRRSEEKTEIASVRWIFNAWGGKYESLAEDNQVPDRLLPRLGMPVFRPGLVLEGGSIDTNGAGTCLVTEQCLLNPNRNPHLGRSGIEKALGDFHGFTHFIWLGEGIEGDDTDGHVDDIARFVNPMTVVAAVEENPSDRNQTPLRENLKRLGQAADQEGKKISVIPIPMPGRVEDSGNRLPASYLNFYIANGVVLVPIFGHANDREALQTLQKLFPDRKVVGIRSEALVVGLGGIHCVTHEQPAL